MADDRPALDIEVTDAMIEAGVRAFHSWDSRVQEPDGLVIAVFEAMMMECCPRCDALPPQSDPHRM